MQCQKLIPGKRKINASSTFIYPKVMMDLFVHQPERQMQVSERISNILNIDQIQRPLAPFKAKTIAAEYKYVYFTKYFEYNSHP
jgi:hypothetical protein